MIGDLKNYPRHLILILTVFLTLVLFANCGHIESEQKSEEDNSASINKSDDSTGGLNNSNIIDPDAVDLLRHSLDYLSNLTQFSVQAQSTMEDIDSTGHRVDLEIASSVIVSRPNKIHIERHGSRFNQLFYFNGKTLTLYNPSDKVYATESAPGTIDEMFHFVRDNFGISTPVSDLLYSNSFALLMYEVEHAVVIGKEMIREVQCDHLLFSRPGVDFQIWISDSGPPLPFKFVVTDTATPELLAFTTVTRNWDTTPTMLNDLFNFKPPPGTNEIIFLKAD